MKNSFNKGRHMFAKIGFTCLLIVAPFSWALSNEALMTSASSTILKDIKEEVKKCAAKDSGSGTAAQFKSTCSSVRLISKSQAQILLGSEWFTAKVSESEDSDGGDLDNLKVYNSRGELVAQRSNVIAYDNVVYAMIGGAANFSGK
jgi:hypothetical protein